MISLAFTKGLAEAIADKGGNADLILGEFGLEHSNLVDPEGFIATAKFALLLEETARATGDDFFGLHFGAGFNPKNIGPAIYVVLNSPTIGAGIENVERYLKDPQRSSPMVYPHRGRARIRGVRIGGIGN